MVKEWDWGFRDGISNSGYGEGYFGSKVSWLVGGNS